MDRRGFLGLMATTAAAAVPTPPSFASLNYAQCLELKHRFELERHDMVASAQALKDITMMSQKLTQIRQTVGYGNFNLLGFDDMVQVARRYSDIGAFTPEALELFESLFYRNAAVYGFYGEKVFASMTHTVNKNDTVKIPRSGHYLYKGTALDTYERIQQELGSSIVLTSGVRGVVKQMDLFLRKVVRSRGNLSVASRSLAPAGYSFHGIGDFDVGKSGYGYKNFTAAFARTDEFKRLMDSGYIQIRYPKGNPYGVRFEPWHIKVV